MCPLSPMVRPVFLSFPSSLALGSGHVVRLLPTHDARAKMAPTKKGACDDDDDDDDDEDVNE